MRKLIHRLILLLLAITPILGIVEITDYLEIPIDIDMLYVKLPKDIFLLLIFFCSFIYFVNHKYSSSFYIGFFTLLFFTVFCFILSSNNLQIAVAGLRWALPFFLAFLLYNIIDYSLLEKIGKVLFLLIILCVVLQIYEMFNMPPIGGYNVFGYTGRLPGFFIHPSACGTFAAFCFFYFKCYSEGKKKILGLIFALVCVFLSMSSTSIILVALLLLVPLYMKSKFKPILFFIIFILMALSIYNIDLLTGRTGGDTLTSGSTRLEILSDVVNSSQFVSTKFGSATNTAMNLLKENNHIENAFIADSLYISVLTNYGILFFIGFIAIIFFLLYTAFIRVKNDMPFISFVLILVFSGIPIITVELFPINLISVIFLSYYSKKYMLFSKVKG